MFGVYEDVLIAGSHIEKGKGDDDPVVVVTFLIEGEPKSAWLYTTEKAWPWTVKKLRNCGYDPEENDLDLSPLNYEGDANPIAGRRVRVEVSEETFEGKIRDKIAWIGPPEKGANFADRMSLDDAKVFSTNLRKRILAAQGPGAAKKPARRSSPAAASGSGNVSSDTGRKNPGPGDDEGLGW